MKILIIGGGLAGPVLALALKRAGYEVHIFDRVEAPHPASGEFEPGALGGGLTLMENGLRVFRRLGLLDSIVAAGTPVLSYDMLNILRCNISRALFTALSKEGVQLQPNKKLVSITQPDPAAHTLGVTAVFSDGTQTSGDILIAADGVHSTVRSILFPDVRPVKTGFVGYLGVSEYDTDVTPAICPTSSLTFLTNNTAGKSAMIMPSAPRSVHWAMYETSPADIAYDGWTSVTDVPGEAARLSAMANYGA
ncbi:FAD/NAD(P)-binding domain-containing protein [Gonapodya prolifera JEL478]|uniref:FAD/NAD(P)-binding domain-containing protein n=1 Tax=Gonapodya prolifera (strain JEL478) TaxID=1344416 RepID=A0A139AJ34_GONPJ|nr:FAD/NAD(P)-binding domain-containing protein [Gonapodya prolifera JEL478]|eukprot:KXS16405.1 FAD/NAD(P)-binding domain-containing protein [Gonapodya prolifera JEL478]